MRARTRFGRSSVGGTDRAAGDGAFTRIHTRADAARSFPGET